jgi:magnesium-transporting ATPase (P-type)
MRNDLDHLEREEAETELIFLGFLIMENKMKKGTVEVV